MLDKIEKSKKNRPPRILLYGTEGIGKSTFAANMPDPIFLPTEDGLDGLEVDTFPLATQFVDITRYLSGLVEQDHKYKTVVIDSVDWLERLIWDYLCIEYNTDSIEKILGGFGKGYLLALKKWREIISLLDLCRAKNMSVCLIAHSKVEKFADPEGPTYDRYSPRLHKEANSLLCEWVDVVAFATRKIRITQEDQGFGKKRGIAKSLIQQNTDRVLRCVGSPSCIAKNRYGLPEEIPFDWEVFVSHL